MVNPVVHLPEDMRARTIGDYLAALSQGAPTPGGGSAAALAGSLGCSLGAMVCALTTARHPSAELSQLNERLATHTQILLECAVLDEQAFGAYRDAIARPRSTEVEKSARRAAVEEALVNAAQVPLDTIATGLSALECLAQVAKIGTPHALGDLMTGGYLLQAMVRGCLENVEANANLMKSPENRERFEQAARSAREELDAAVGKLASNVAARAG